MVLCYDSCMIRKTAREGLVSWSACLFLITSGCSSPPSEATQEHGGVPPQEIRRAAGYSVAQYLRDTELTLPGSNLFSPASPYCWDSSESGLPGDWKLVAINASLRTPQGLPWAGRSVTVTDSLGNHFEEQALGGTENDGTFSTTLPVPLSLEVRDLRFHMDRSEIVLWDDRSLIEISRSSSVSWQTDESWDLGEVTVKAYDLATECCLASGTLGAQTGGELPTIELKASAILPRAGRADHEYRPCFVHLTRAGGWSVFGPRSAEGIALVVRPNGHFNEVVEVTPGSSDVIVQLRPRLP